MIYIFKEPFNRFAGFGFEIFHICGYGLPTNPPLLFPPPASLFWHSQQSLEKFLLSSVLSLTYPFSPPLIILGNVVTLIAFSH